MQSTAINSVSVRNFKVRPFASRPAHQVPRRAPIIRTAAKPNTKLDRGREGSKEVVKGAIAALAAAQLALSPFAFTAMAIEDMQGDVGFSLFPGAGRVTEQRPQSTSKSTSEAASRLQGAAPDAGGGVSGNPLKAIRETIQALPRPSGNPLKEATDKLQIKVGTAPGENAGNIRPMARGKSSYPLTFEGFPGIPIMTLPIRVADSLTLGDVNKVASPMPSRKDTSARKYDPEMQSGGGKNLATTKAGQTSGTASGDGGDGPRTEVNRQNQGQPGLPRADFQGSTGQGGF